MSDMNQTLSKLGVIPVVKIDNAADSAPLCEALVKGGLPCAEITFRTAAAPEAIKAASKISGMIVGAGTVLTVDQVKQAMDCGSTFIVSPGFSAKVVSYCVDNKIPVYPGVCTPTEIQMGMEHGLDVLKFFPAENYGGIKTLKSIAPVYGSVKFIPTGGITLANLKDYRALPNVLACGGSWLCTADLINNKKFDEIETLARDAVALANS